MEKGVSGLNKILIPLIFAGVLLILLMFGETGGKEPLILDEISSLMTASGVQIDGYYLEGWAFLRDSAESTKVWEGRRIAELLGLGGCAKKINSAVTGGCFQAEYTGDDYQARIMLQKVRRGSATDKTFLSVRCNLSGGTQESVSWEKRIKQSLASLGEEYGVYLTVKGGIAAGLDEDALMAWGEAVFRDFNAKAEDTLRTDRYTSMTGYSPVLPKAAIGGNNLNLSIVRKKEKIDVLLGTPLITCEY